MLQFEISNARERQHLEHSAGPIEFGRGPQRHGVPRCMIQDAYVSKDHVRVEEVAEGQLRVENLSARGPVVTAEGQVAPGGVAVIRVPARLAIGESVIDIRFGVPDDQDLEAMKTVGRPLHAWNATEARECVGQLDAGPTPEVMTRWFEAVVAVQRSSPTSPEYYDQTARALVELIGMDTGLVLVRNGEAWRVVARAYRDEGVAGREFSMTIVNHVVRERRTFYRSRLSAESLSDSLSNVLSVVASPIFDASNDVVGAVYGTRGKSARGREIRPLEAQLVQVLASAVTAGLVRMEQEMRTSQMRVAKEAAEGAARAKSQFLANMSHELRTPLNAIIGYSEMIGEMMQDDGVTGYQEDLAKVTAAGRHLLSLINDILDHSKLMAGKMPLNLESLEVEPLVQEVAATVRPLAQKNGNEVVVKVPTPAGQMTADPTRLRQCLLNLLSNACKFTDQGTVTLAVERLAKPDREWILFRVMDTGIGIAADKLDTIFDEFEQADRSTTRKYGGTGLGLSISRSFCRMMGGDITVRSETGKGSVFTICLPAVVEGQREATDVPTLPAEARG